MRIQRLQTEGGRQLVVEVPETPWERLRGLLGRTGLAEGSGMLFLGARSVHTVGMGFEILVAFLDADLRVLEVVRARPGRVLLPRRRARHVLELPVGTPIHPGEVLHRAPT